MRGRRASSSERPRIIALAVGLMLLGSVGIAPVVPSNADDGQVLITGELVAGDPAEPVAGAGVSLRFYDDRGFWNIPDAPEGSNVFATTAIDGSFTLVVPAATLSGRQWVLAVAPPFTPVGVTPTLGATVLPVPAGLASATTPFDLGDFALGAPDVIGTVLSGDTPQAHDGAFVSLLAAVGDRTYSLPFEFGTGADGRFALKRPDPAAFDASLSGDARASLGAGLATTLSIRDAGDAIPGFEVDLTAEGDLTAISATFPTPNVTGTLTLPTDPATPVGGASFEVQRQVEGTFEESGQTFLMWEWAGAGGRTSTADGSVGEFAVAFDFPTGEAAVPHRLFFQAPPDGGPYSAFTVALTDDDGAPLAGLTSLTPQYPTADIYGVLLFSAGGDGVDPVPVPSRNGVVSVQRRITDEFGSRWEWTDAFGQPQDDGTFAISLAGSDADGFSTEGWRLRATVFDDEGNETISFASPLAADGSDWLTQQLVVPTPNVTGTVRADLDPTVDGLEGLVGARVELRRFNETFGFWDWTDVQTSTTEDGAFSLVLPDDEREGRLELHVRPQGGLRGVLPAFSYALPFPLADDADLTDLVIVAPTPDLQGIVRSGGVGVGGAWVQLERLIESPFGEFWEWAEGFATTASSGLFALNAPDVDDDARYRVRVIPPYFRTGELVEFTVELEGTGVSGGIALDFPAANVQGNVIDPSGAPVADAWVNVQVWNETGGYWDWLTSAVTRGGEVGAGAFALYVDPDELGDRRARLDVRSPGDRDDLVPFQVDLDLAGGGAALTDLTFPSPNLSVTITRDTDSGPAAVRGAYAWVERILEDGSEQTDLWQSTGRTGLLSLRVPDAGTYRLHVHGPWGQDLPTFQRDFTVDAEGTVTFAAPLLGGSLNFPSPNLTIDVEDADGAPVQFAHIELRRYDATADEWVWVPQNGTADRSGSAALAVEAGTYRVYVHPPWFAGDLTIGLVEVDVTVRGSASETVVLTGPNVEGTLAQGSGVTGWSWIEVTPPDPVNDPAVPGTYIPATGPTAGEFGLRLLPDGDHGLTVWPGQGSAFTAPLEVVVTIAGGEVSAWRYAVETPGTDRCPDSGACTLALDFADPALAANLGGTVTRDGAVVAGAFVTANATGEGTAGTPADWQGVAVTGADGTFSLLIPTDVTVELLVAIPEGDGVLVASLPGGRDASSGLALALEVGGLLTALGTPPSTPAP